MLKSLRDSWLRIDARSLGLFRVLFGVVLLWDWARRYRWIKEFYSNDGVLPNHNHIFLLHEHTRVWSALHAFSSPGEATFAFWVIFVVYVFFLVGFHTRAFQALALVCMVSLTGRNILMENAGNYAAIALLAFTLFLPLGTRFSLDAMRRSLDARDETDGDALNAPPETDEEHAAKRGWGWSPTSIAALGLLIQICIVYAAHAYQREGSWLDGTALGYALASDLRVSHIGAAARSLPPGLLSAWTYALRYAEVLVPALVLFPALPRIGRFTRTAAIALAVFYGLSFAALFEYGLFGGSLVAAAALFVPPESWRARLAPVKSRTITVIYDADCGVCLWICRMLRRLDLRGHIAFQGNDSLANLVVRDGATFTTEEVPAAVTPELVLDSVVVVDADRRVITRGAAVAAALRALPLGFLLAGPMRLPGVSSLLDVAYDFVAARRQGLSVAMGKEACGVPIPPAEPQPAGEADEMDDPEYVAPATRAARVLSGGVREIAAAVLLLSVVAQTGHANPVPAVLTLNKPLAALAQWPRMIGRWDVFAPEPSRDAEVFVVDAQTRSGVSVDPLTGVEPVFDPAEHGPLFLGPLWADYLTRVHEHEWAEFQRAFRDYLGKGGPRWENPLGDLGIAGFDAYWSTASGSKDDEPAREKLFSFSRGGKTGGGAVKLPIAPGHAPIRPFAH